MGTPELLAKLATGSVSAGASEMAGARAFWHKEYSGVVKTYGGSTGTAEALRLPHNSAEINAQRREMQMLAEQLVTLYQETRTRDTTE